MDSQSVGTGTLTFSEEPVRFRSRGCRLFGIFHPAKNGSRDFGIVFANSGMQNRVGPHRLYVVLARLLSDIGYSVLRIDLPGIGESEGTIAENHFDVHDPEDVRRAVDFLKQEKRIERIALFGVCAGARVALKTGSLDDRVDGLILWSLPIISIAPNMTSPQDGWMTKKGVYQSIRDRARKATSLQAWKRYFESGGNLGLIYRDMRGIFWTLVSRERWSQDRHQRFFSALSGYIRSGRSVLFVYGELDNVLVAEFREKFREVTAGIEHSCECRIIPHGNHTFTAMDTQGEAISETVHWLSRWTNGKVHS